MNEKQFMSLRDVAERLEISIQTAQRLRKAGKLPREFHFGIGEKNPHARWSRAEVEQWLKGGGPRQEKGEKSQVLQNRGII